MKSNLSLNSYHIIEKKKDGKALSDEEIKWFINKNISRKIPDYQMSALLMAICINGMNSKETAALTDAMYFSGKYLTFEGPQFVDKHSTGGVGDKTSFIIAPIASLYGIKVPMMAGRGLGHTGGTIDKIESIKGFKTSLSLNTFKKQLIEEGIVLTSQTKDIAPADKIIYALRDVTATVESIPLITASIMSKKLAEGANGIVMDVKTGDGAFMSNIKDAKLLAKSLRNTAKRFNKKIITMITNMNAPLGNYIGNSLEIIESIETLKGKGPSDLTNLSIKLAGAMIYIGKKASSLKEGEMLAEKSIKNGKALKVFEKLISIQGGNKLIIDDYSLLPIAKESTSFIAKRSGYITKIACKQIGNHCISLGGGRRLATDKIDPSVGIIINKKIGEKVLKNEPILKIIHHSKQKGDVQDILIQLKNEIIIKPKKGKPLPLIFEVKEI